MDAATGTAGRGARGACGGAVGVALWGDRMGGRVWGGVEGVAVWVASSMPGGTGDEGGGH